MNTESAPPSLSYLATITVQVGTPIEMGETNDGVRRIIPIIGGTVTGPDISGEVLNAGADYQVLRTDTLTELEAKYAIRTDEGDYLYIENFGIRSGSAEDIAALVRGDEVDPARIYFRCTPRIRATGEKWAWLSSRILVGDGERFPDSVHLRVYVVD